MIVRKEHAVMLERLLKDQDSRLPYTEISPEQTPVLHELERAGLVRQQTPVRWVPTYSGAALAQVLRDLYAQGPAAYAEAEDEVGGDLVVREARGLGAPETWPDDWRWLGSEVIAMLDAAARAERVGPKAEQALLDRGLAMRVWDRAKKAEYVILSDAGRAVLDIYTHAHPRLLIDETLAEFIRKVPVGPAPSDRLPTGSHEEHLLEAMRLIAYSVPISDAFAFTALGQAVKRALETGGFGTGTVLSEDLLWALAQHADGEPISEAALARLQALAYVDAAGELLPAGEWALEALRLWWDGPRAEVWTLAVEAEEVEVLQTIDALWNRYAQSGNKDDIPTFGRLRREMIDRKVKEYKALLERYGRRIKEMPKKFQAIAQQFAEAKDLARWYDDNFALRETLYSLESFNLLASEEDDAGREVFRLTDIGRQVLADHAERRRDIPSTAVKAITMTRKMFSAPALEWWQQAHDAGLVGTAEPTKSGWMYAHLAETLVRKPHLTRFEMEVFHLIPARGMTEGEIYKQLEAKGEDPERIRWALEKLEARHLIEILPDGNVVETPAGELMDQALAGVPEGFGNPVNPIILRVLAALREVGTLYVKERKVRVLPRNIQEAWKRSGLSREAFDDALKAARVAGFLGRNAITTAGLLLLEAAEAMNPAPGEQLQGYAGPLD
ncbi:MAG: DUF505 domain-containing protein [Chloroflexi bacterium]|nr:DUF505 domain-containing protein [Chloroflexota bacterium]